jgi:hypothetical protein
MSHRNDDEPPNEVSLVVLFVLLVVVAVALWIYWSVMA